MPRHREPAPCSHRSLCQLRDTCGSAFPLQNALRKQILWLDVTTRNPLVRGKCRPARGRALPPVTEAEIQPAAGAEPEPSPLYPRAGRAESTWELPLEPSRVRISLISLTQRRLQRRLRAGLGSPRAEGEHKPSTHRSQGSALRPQHPPGAWGAQIWH